MATDTEAVLSVEPVDPGHGKASALSLESLAPPLVFTALMLVVAWVVTSSVGVSGWVIVVPYLAESAVFFFIASLAFCFWRVMRFWREGEPTPLIRLVGEFRSRLDLLLIQLVLAPLFIAGYTMVKTATPFTVGYGWDYFWAAVDRRMFGADAWRLSVDVLGTGYSPIWQWSYSFGWVFVAAFANFWIALGLPRKQAVQYFAAIFGAWFAGGFVMAYTLSTAGPIYAHLFDPRLVAQFAPLREMLALRLGPTSPIAVTQSFLEQVRDTKVAVMGSGISAMPSLHVVWVAMVAVAVRRTWWFLPACAFALFIFIGSAYFGYHYWIDGIVSVVLVAGCWWASGRYFRWRAQRQRTHAIGTVLGPV